MGKEKFRYRFSTKPPKHQKHHPAVESHPAEAHPPDRSLQPIIIDFPADLERRLIHSSQLRSRPKRSALERLSDITSPPITVKVRPNRQMVCDPPARFNLTRRYRRSSKSATSHKNHPMTKSRRPYCRKRKQFTTAL